MIATKALAGRWHLCDAGKCLVARSRELLRVRKAWIARSWTGMGGIRICVANFVHDRKVGTGLDSICRLGGGLRCQRGWPLDDQLADHPLRTLPVVPDVWGRPLRVGTASRCLEQATKSSVRCRNGSFPIGPHCRPDRSRRCLGSRDVCFGVPACVLTCAPVDRARPIHPSGHRLGRWRNRTHCLDRMRPVRQGGCEVGPRRIRAGVSETKGVDLARRRCDSAPIPRHGLPDTALDVLRRLRDEARRPSSVRRFAGSQSRTNRQTRRLPAVARPDFGRRQPPSGKVSSGA